MVYYIEIDNITKKVIIMEQMPFEKGRELERQIEKFFLLHGYQTKKNVHLEGKSGGKHEIDIGKLQHLFQKSS